MVSNVGESIRANKAALQIVLSVATLVLVSVYFLILTSFYNDSKSLPNAVKAARWENFWVIAALICAVVQIWLTLLPDVAFVDRSSALDALLEIAAWAVAFPKTPGQRDLRVFCHLIAKNDMLIPRRCWFTDVPDDLVPIPLALPFTISKSFQNRQVIADDIPAGAIDTLPPKLRTRIRKKIRSVIAAPICDLENVHSRPIGTISIDSGYPKDVAKLDTPSARNIVNLVAKCVYFAVKPKAQ